MPFQKGNQLAANARRWRAAIDKALENRCKSDGQKALVEIAEQLLELASQGDLGAIKELGDRIDGKPHQTTMLEGNPDAPIVVKEARFVSPGD